MVHAFRCRAVAGVVPQLYTEQQDDALSLLDSHALAFGARSCGPPASIFNLYEHKCSSRGQPSRPSPKITTTMSPVFAYKPLCDQEVTHLIRFSKGFPHAGQLGQGMSANARVNLQRRGCSCHPVTEWGREHRRPRNRTFLPASSVVQKQTRKTLFRCCKSGGRKGNNWNNKETWGECLICATGHSLMIGGGELE